MNRQAGKGKEMKTHELKIWPEYFQAIQEGRKTYELRRNDRGFEVGDTLILREYKPETELFTDREIHVIVTGVDSIGNGMSCRTFGGFPIKTTDIREWVIMSFRKDKTVNAYFDDENKEEFGANADLLAAAPELLEAANMALKFFDDEFEPYMTPEYKAKAVEMLNSAIKKAEET